MSLCGDHWKRTQNTALGCDMYNPGENGAGVFMGQAPATTVSANYTFEAS